MVNEISLEQGILYKYCNAKKENSNNRYMQILHHANMILLFLHLRIEIDIRL